MVTISYIGRFGNLLFQYVFGRLIAEKNGLKLMAEWKHPEVIQFSPNPDGKINTTKIRIDDQHSSPTDLAWLDACWSSYHVDLRGYFQHPRFYDQNETLIKSWMVLPAHKEDHSNDVVCHLRLGDYDVTGGIPIIDKSWYIDLLKTMPDKKIYIVCQGVYSDGERAYNHLKAWERKYIDELGAALSGRNVTFISGTLASDFHFIRSFGTIIMSNSSLAWWAAWLSDAKKIYTFSRWRHKSPHVQLAFAKNMLPVGGSYIWEKEQFVP